MKVMQMQAFLALILQSPGGGTSWLAWAPLVFIFVIFYFLLIMPQQRRQKQWKSMLSDLKTGDRVTTSGGVKGTIVALRDDNVHLRVPPDNIRLEIARSAIVAVTSGEEATKSS